MENRRRYIKTALIVCAVLSHFSCPGGKSYQAGRAGDSIFLHLINYNYSRGRGLPRRKGSTFPRVCPRGLSPPARNSNGGSRGALGVNLTSAWKGEDSNLLFPSSANIAWWCLRRSEEPFPARALLLDFLLSREAKPYN